MNKITLENGVVLTYGPISVDKVEPNQYNAQKWQAQVRQEVTSVYPAARAHNSLSDGLFNANEFGEGQSFVEKRVAWVPCPPNSTIEQIDALIQANPTCVLHKTLSIEPILSDEQKTAMERGINTLTLEDYAERYVKDENGAMVTFAGNPFYRSINFKKSYIQDTDLRSAEIDSQGAVQMGTPASEVVATAQHAETVSNL